jgi:peptidoglycan-associated lipoprotein
MRTSKILIVLLIASLASGCACRTKKVGPGGDNVPGAEAGRELKDINFAFDSYSLDGNAKAILQTNADWLKANSERKAQVEGHCDERGTNEYNMALGANRARAAQDYMKTLGIDGTRISVVSYGEELPLDPRHNDEAWAKNRRDHFNIN